MLMKHAMIKYTLAAACALVFAGTLFGAPFAMHGVFADEAQNVATVDETGYTSFEEALSAWQKDDKSTLTLLQDATIGTKIEVTGNKTLDLSTHTLSPKAEVNSSLFSVEGTLTVKGGKLTGGNAERGGGIYVDSRGQLTLDGCEVSGNTAAKDGGGVYVVGTLTLSGNTVVENNTDGSGNASNIFLTGRYKILLNGFTGRAGVTVIDESEPFAEVDEASTGVFLSDDKDYVAENGKLKTAPLQSITAVYENDGKVFPTTSFDELKEHVTVSGVNVNGVPYTKPLEVTLAGNLSVGTSTLTVTAVGEEGERATTEIEVEVSEPSLVSIEVVAPEFQPKVYFDSALSALTGEGGYTFKGIYDDGNPRFLPPEGEGKDGYVLEGDLSVRTDGRATVTVRAGNVTAQFGVEVSKYAIAFTKADAVELSALEGGAFDARNFVPSLPGGVDIVARIGGAALDFPALLPGVYDVTLTFAVTDRENYEDISSELETRLTVLRRELSGELDGGVYSAAKEGGLLPGWSLRAEDITDAVTVKFDGSLEAQAVFEVTLEENGVVVESPGALTVRLPVPESLRGEEITLYLLNTDGTLTEVGATREEDALVFSANSLAHARYVFAVETASQIYLILSIVFGVACVAGAAALLFYLVVKRKMSLR